MLYACVHLQIQEVSTLQGCSQLAGISYKTRHDNVARYIHWCLCGKHNIEHHCNWWQHSPASIAENDNIKILWEFNIFVDHLISARRPDIAVINKKAATMS